MKWFLIPIALISVFGIRFQKNGFRQDYLGIASTTAINGIFTMLVMFDHIKGSLNSLAAPGEKVVFSAGGGLSKYLSFGQLVVVTFLFFSGYAIAQSLLKKPDYLREMPKNRLLRVWFHFACAILVYLIVGLCMQNELKPGTVLFSFIGWKSIGNSNWYMFDTFCLYIITIAAFRIGKKKPVPSIAIVTGLTLALIGGLYLLKADYVFYDTIILYPLGMWFSVLQPGFTRFVQKNTATYIFSLFAAGALFAVFHFLRIYTGVYLFFEPEALALVLTIVIALMKFKIGNPVLNWLGKNLFWVYILQRLPMNVMNRYVPNINTYVYVVITVAVTVALTFGFSAAFKPIDKKLFPKKATSAA